MKDNSCEILDYNILLTLLTDDPARHDDGADDASSKVLYSRTRARLNQHSTQNSRHDFSEFIVDTFIVLAKPGAVAAAPHLPHR